MSGRGVGLEAASL